MKFIPVTRSFFLWQEISSCDKKFLTMAWNFFPCQDISSCNRTFLPLTRNFILWQEISSCDKKFLTFFLWQEISSNAKEFLSVTGHLCLWQEIPFCPWYKSFLSVTRNFFLWQETISCMLCVIDRRNPSFDRKCGNTLKSNSHQNSVNCCQNLLPLTRNFFLWQIFFSYDKKCVPLKRDFFFKPPG